MPTLFLNGGNYDNIRILEKSKPVTVFSELNKKDVPWKEKYSNTVMLDNLYQYSHSNKLICASLCDNLDLSTLVEMIYTLNIENWAKLYENYTIVYNPIENYSMTEKGKKLIQEHREINRQEMLEANQRLIFMLIT